MPGRRRTEGKTERPRRPALLADHVTQVVRMDVQLERGVLARTEDLDLDILAVVDDAAGQVRDQIPKLRVNVVRFTRPTQRSRGGVARWTGTDDRRRPASRSAITHRPDKAKVGRGRLSLWTARPLAQRPAPTSHTITTVRV